jgi:hypothetical protein
MELLLDVPTFMHPLLRWMVRWIVALQLFWQYRIHDPWNELCRSALQQYYHFALWRGSSDDVEDDTGGIDTNNSNNSMVLPILAILLVFWPIVLSIVVTIISGGTWMIWLATSIVLGILQVGYATYHFAMIAVDIGALSLLKTYAVLRSQVLYGMEIWTNSMGNSMLPSSERKKTSNGLVVQQSPPVFRSSKSRRRHWRQCLEQAGTYENFLKIRIAPKDERNMAFQKYAEAGVDSALPPHLNIKRNHSFPERHAATPPSSPPSDSPSGAAATGTLQRRFSLTSAYLRSNSLGRELTKENGNCATDTRAATTATTAIELDPRVVEELGEKTAHLLVTTTARLDEARRAVQADPTDENAKALKYLISAVVKRNHLTLDDILVENSRSIAVAGEYGLTSQSRQVIRAYYEQVEQGLDWLAEAPSIEPSNNQKNTSSSSNKSMLGHFDHADPFAERLPLPPPRPHDELIDRMNLVRKMKQNMGRTALMLSGGGAQAMYHAGLLRSLVESKLYKDISVVSGTSGGSIMAAVRLVFFCHQ